VSGRPSPGEPAPRVERDSLGPVEVPAGVKWGPQTQRAVENFPISGIRMERALLWALATIKGAAAEVNARRGVIARDAAGAIRAAAVQVARGDWDEQFPVDVYQTGSGTSTNMNMNEVLATIAADELGRRVHPNDEVNASQSSNDVFPSAIRLAALHGIVTELLPALEHLARTLGRQARANAAAVKAGRTHLMDATPVTVGQELAGHRAQVLAATERLGAAVPRLGELPIGGTAVGTGVNAPKGFGRAVARMLAAELDLPLREAPDHFAAQGAQDVLVDASAQLRGAAVALLKIANDLRWMASGPRAGLAEIRLPELQPGSSIMPGKVNPVLPEAVAQVAVQVIGNDSVVALAGSQGSFELNTYLPLMARNLLESIRLLANVSRLFADRCVAGLVADAARCRAYAEASPAVATALAPILGYETVAGLVQDSVASGRAIRELVAERGLLPASEVDRLLDLEAMTRGGRSG